MRETILHQMTRVSLLSKPIPWLRPFHMFVIIALQLTNILCQMLNHFRQVSVTKLQFILFIHQVINQYDLSVWLLPFGL